MHQKWSIPVLLTLCTAQHSLVACHDALHQFSTLKAAVEYDRQLLEVEISRIPHLVMFYAPWCGHCKRLSTTYDKLAEKYNSELNGEKAVIAKVDCTKHTELCSDHGVLGYPTLLFFWSQSSPTKKFKGKRDFNVMDQFIQQMIQVGPPAASDEQTRTLPTPAHKKKLYELTADTFDDYIATGQHFVKFYAPWCSHCKILAPTWNLLAESFETDETVSVAKVDCTEHKSVCTKNLIRGYPTLIYFHQGIKIDDYRGARDLNSLREFVIMMKAKIAVEAPEDVGSNYVTSSPVLGTDAANEIPPPNLDHSTPPTVETTIPATDGQHRPDFIEPPIIHTAPSPDIVAATVVNANELNINGRSEILKLSASLFERRIRIADRIHIVLFYTPSCTQCQQFRLAAWLQLPAKLVHSSVTFSEVDCVEEQSLCALHEIHNFPTIQIFHNGVRADTYRGVREVEPLSSFIYSLSLLLLEADEQRADKEAGLITLNGETFHSTFGADSFTFVAFTLPWSLQCKSLAPVWRELARSFLEDLSVTIAKVDCHQHKDLCRPTGTEYYPVLMLYYGGNHIGEYNGKRDIESLRSFVIEKRILHDEL